MGAGERDPETAQSRVTLREIRLPQNAGQFASQRGQVLIYGVPNDIGRHIEVGVNQAVAHSNDIDPGDVWLAHSKIHAHLRCGLADDFQILDDGERAMGAWRSPVLDLQRAI